MPVKASYNIARLLMTLQREFVPAEEARVALIRKHSGPGETVNGQMQWSVLPENHEACMAELKVLAETEVEIDRRPLPLALLEGTQLTPADMVALGPLVAEPADEE